MKFKSTILVFILFIFTLNVTFSQGYKIKVKIRDLQDTSIILGYHMDGKMLAKDTAMLDNKGAGAFTGEVPLQGGMYFIFLPSKNIFNILIGDDQKFSIETNKDNFTDNMNISGSEENELFYQYELFLKEKGQKAKALRDELKQQDETDKKNKEKIQAEMEELNKEVEAEQNRLISEYPQTFLASFIRATQPVEVPDPPLDENGEPKDKNFRYKYYKQHYFDNINFSDDRLLRTSIFKPKLKEYFDKYVVQIPDSIIKDADRVINMARQNDEVFKYVLGTLYNKYNQSKIMGHDAVFVHLAEYYINGEADWADSSFVAKIKERVDKTKPNLIGNTAPNIRAVTINNRFIDLHAIKSDYLVILFYEPDCGHCKKEVPKMREIYHRLKDKGLQVLGFYTQGDTAKWYEFVREKKLDWINVWSPYSNKYRDLYNIYSTPTIYVLDKDKEIIAKRVGAEQIEKIVTEHLLVEKLDEVDKENDKEVQKAFKSFLKEFDTKEGIETAKEVIFMRRLSDEQKEEIEKLAGKLSARLE